MKTMILERRGPIAFVTFNRPEVLNALDVQVMEEMLLVIELLTKGQQVKALIITGAGEKAFIAGADIKAMQQMSSSEAMEFLNLGQKVANAFENAPYITLAAVNGYALGGGFEMALSCDFIYAASTAKFGLPEITLGVIPGFGGTQRLTKALGPRLAKDLVLTGRIISAEEAKNLGIVNHISQPAELIQDCTEAIERMVKFSSTAIHQAKKAIQSGSSLSLDIGLELEKNLFSVCFNTQERIEAMGAFIDKKGKK